MDLTDFALSEVLYDSLSSVSDVSSLRSPSASFNEMMEKAVKYIDKFQDKSFREVYFILLPHIVRSCDKVEIATSLDTYIFELLRTHRDSAPNLEIIFKILNETIKATAIDGDSMVSVPQRVTLELVEILMCKEDAVPGLIDCLQLHIRNSKDGGVVSTIWSRLLERISENMSCKQAGQIMIEFSDNLQEIVPNFFKHETFVKVLQELLLNDFGKEQKYGLHLLKTVIAIITQPQLPSLWELDYSMENGLFWNTYFEIMKALVEERFEAVQPLLQTIMNHAFRGAAYKNWMSILLIKMQKVESVAMKRLAMENILQRFKCEDISANLFSQLTKALNNFHMYNFEEYFIPEQNIEKFLDCDCTQLLESLAHINWQSVPFHFWLKQLAIHKNKSLNVQNLSKELVMKIATKVRLTQNVKVRIETIRQFENLFNEFLTNMSVADHIALMETLCKIGDYCSATTISSLLKKSSIVKDDDITTETFSKHLYEIICVNFLKNDDHFELLLKTLTNLPKEKHGWLRFLLVFDTPADKLSKIYEFCRSKYELDLEGMTKLTLSEISHEFRSKLSCKEDKRDFVDRKSLNFFADQKVSDLKDLEMTVGDFLERGDVKTVVKLSKILEKSNQKLASKDFDVLLNKLKTNMNKLELFGQLTAVIKNIFNYIKKAYPDEKCKLAERILNLDSVNYTILHEFSNGDLSLSNDVYKTAILRGEPKQGEERIEEIYSVRIQNERWTDLMYTRYKYSYSLFKNGDVPGVVACLLKHHKELSANLNSNQGLSLEHRQQMRIAYAVCSLICVENSNKKLSCSDDLWEILLERKQRPSVTYLYEFAIALNSPNMQKIEEQLKKAVKYDEGRQLSVISITFNYCEQRLKDSPAEIDKVIKLLLPLALNANPKSRVVAQMAIVLILEKWIEKLKPICDHTNLLATLKLSIGDEFSELIEDVRFQIMKIYQTKKFFGEVCDCVFYITNEPYDEYYLRSEERIKSIEKSKVLYEKQTVSSIIPH